MDQFLAFTVVGLSTAAICAVIGSGLVLAPHHRRCLQPRARRGRDARGLRYWQLAVGWGRPVPLALAAVLLVMTVALLTGCIALARWVWDPNIPPPAHPLLRRRYSLTGFLRLWLARQPCELDRLGERLTTPPATATHPRQKENPANCCAPLPERVH